MNTQVKIALGISVLSLTIAVFVFIIPSLMGFLLALLGVVATVDYLNRRYRSAARTFNSAARSVCHREGAMTKVAATFATSGPLRGSCYEYARRLIAGQDPISSAGAAGVPLQLSTAVAMKQSQEDSASEATRRKTLDDHQEFLSSDIDSTVIPAYAQMIYVIVTVIFTCCALTFTTIFIMPTIEKMLDEFGLQQSQFWNFSKTFTQYVMTVVIGLLLLLIPYFSLSSFFGLSLPSWLPASPSSIDDRAEVLVGLADAIDAGMTVDQGLNLASEVSLKHQYRKSLAFANHLIQQGTSPAIALHQAGWISVKESDWLSGVSAARGAELLRTIAEQRIKDARANLRFLTGLAFPILILIVGFAVLAYAAGFFSSLTTLISALG